jgi:hypothetical protein
MVGFDILVRITQLPQVTETLSQPPNYKPSQKKIPRKTPQN